MISAHRTNEGGRRRRQEREGAARTGNELDERGGAVDFQ